MTEYEKVNEPIVLKLDRVAANYERGKIGCPDPHYVARCLRETAERIRKNHAEKVRTA